MNPAIVEHPSKIFSLEFFDPCIVLVNLHTNDAGAMHVYVLSLEKLLKTQLTGGAEYCLIFNFTARRDDAFSAEDIELIHVHMKTLRDQYSCRTAHFVMNEGLHYHINRGMAEPYCSNGVYRAGSISDAVHQIEAELGLEIVFDSLPVSCC